MGGVPNRKAILALIVVAIVLSCVSIRFATLLDVSGLADRSDDHDGPTSTRIAQPVSTVVVGNASQRPSAHAPHPHAGAKDANGHWGFVADVGLVRRSVGRHYYYHHPRNDTTTAAAVTPPSSYLRFRDEKREFDAACNAAPREGKERKAGWRLLTQRVQVNGPDPRRLPLVGGGGSGGGGGGEAPTHIDPTSSTRTDPTSLATTATPPPPPRRIPRILCVVYTYDKRHEMVTAVGDTWGWKCDGFFAASTKTVEVLDGKEEGLGAIDLAHLGPEKYQNMWQKTRSILAYIFDHYLDDFDFFFLSGDDTYLIVENLRRTLLSLGELAWEYPLYMGHWIPEGVNGSYYCGGGPGYVLNRKTLELFVRDVLPSCHADMVTAAEDRTLGRCLRSVGIVGNHSVDATNAQRFHGMDPHDVCTMKGDSGFFGTVYQFWGQHYGFKTGVNLTSRQSVSFHMLKTARHLKRIHAILYKSCPPNTTLGTILGPSSTIPN